MPTRSGDVRRRKVASRVRHKYGDSPRSHVTGVEHVAHFLCAPLAPGYDKFPLTKNIIILRLLYDRVTTIIS